MPNFLLVYHGGKEPETPEEGEAMMAAWMAWFNDMGEAVVDGGNPVGQSYTVSASGIAHDGGANPVSGYTVIAAETLDAACAMAQACPIMGEGGSIEVAEIHQVG
jgi:hypothetical protein